MKYTPHNECLSKIIKYLDARVKGHSKPLAQKMAGIDYATDKYLKRNYKEYENALLIFRKVDKKRVLSFYPKG